MIRPPGWRARRALCDVYGDRTLPQRRVHLLPLEPTGGINPSPPIACFPAQDKPTLSHKAD